MTLRVKLERVVAWDRNRRPPKNRERRSIELRSDIFRAWKDVRELRERLNDGWYCTGMEVVEDE